eukprot:CAMPEP_0174733516 /NCGR_PEP_ID=MMETSP1094-20130205/61486_1 /TAXON_ID=156173 /ORGANISM="Chrysochromulina brevifilum, Strain UTEX LB 985" /LENGTH=118 /DNA_ID=CAMNT_0015936195 /DNA_START=468 /DNA_END=824 /DNA_ORIENTATION=-
MIRASLALMSISRTGGSQPTSCSNESSKTNALPTCHSTVLPPTRMWAWYELGTCKPMCSRQRVLCSPVWREMMVPGCMRESRISSIRASVRDPNSVSTAQNAGSSARPVALRHAAITS